jgi:uncharacterized membrane protein YqiK
MHPFYVSLIFAVIGGVVTIILGAMAMYAKCFRKVEQGKALILTGIREKAEVTFTGMLVYPVIHRAEEMDITVKRIEIFRRGSEGLVCMDNLRADIKVAFFVRVNKTPQDVLNVATMLGCQRASDEHELVKFFDSKFSEALKTAGKRFDFVQLYTERDKFKSAIIEIIGTDLNGYVLDDAAIDYLEQTPLESMNEDNILDAEGIKKIRDLTAREKVLANNILREQEKTIKKQDVEAKEAVLALERQQAEAEAKQKREIAEVTAREKAAAEVVEQASRWSSEERRIETERQIGIAEENRMRELVVAQKLRERTTGVESERVTKEKDLEMVERERVVELKRIEKDKVLEEERKIIQDVIRQRIEVERAVVQEEEKIKDTRRFAEAEREKRAAILAAEQEAEQALVKQVKEAEAMKQSATFHADQAVIEAEAERQAAIKVTEAKKLQAEGITAEEAAKGIAEAKILEAKARALREEGQARADSTRFQGVAAAEVTQAQAVASEKQGMVQAQIIEAKLAAEARGVQLKLEAEAAGIREKAEAMKLLDGVGRDHEEFKLRLQKDKEIELAEISTRQGIADSQAKALAEAFKAAKIEIVGGESEFFHNIVGAISNGKRVDKLITNSESLTAVRDHLLASSQGENGQPLKELLQKVEKVLENTPMSAAVAEAVAEAPAAAAAGGRRPAKH